jgi:putative membrane protein
MRFFLRFFVTSGIIYLLIQFQYLSGVSLNAGISSLLVFIFILGLVNLVVGWILRLITLPIRFLSLGLIGFIISVIVVKITDEFVVGVTLNGWTPILIIALVMGIVSAMFA